MDQRDINLVVTDLDGTLWDRDERIHDRTLAALRHLQQRDLPVLVATGRRLASARQRLDADNLHLPVIALDGAVGKDGQRTFHHRAFDTTQALELVDRFAHYRLSPCVYIDHPEIDVVLGRAPSTHVDHLRMLAGTSSTGDLHRTVREHPVFALGAYGVGGAGGEALARLAGELRLGCELQGGHDPFFGGYSLVVYPRGTTKWAGVQSYCDDQGLDERAVLAVGDGPNDVELLTGAAVAFVVSDGCDAALALADHVVDPASKGGWATVLDHV